MRAGEGLLKLKMFQLQERQRQLEQLNIMIGEFEHMSDELDAQIIAEERKCGEDDPDHFSYPPLAHAARHRRENLCHSVHELQIRKQEIQHEIEEAKKEIDQTRIRQTHAERKKRQNLRSFPKLGKRMSKMA